MTDRLRIAIAGLGTVGAGTVQLLNANRDLLRQRTGKTLDIVAISARDPHRDRGFDPSPYRWHDDPVSMATADDVDIVVELIGGSEGPALDLCKATLKASKSLVTANKAMLAHHGLELAQAADQATVHLGYEAAVAGGIPIVKSLREGLAANRFNRVYGILNGTCNYILTTMRETGRDFADVLDEAQTLGYAETDPTFDVEGIDAAHKLALLASLAFGGKPRFDAIHIEGIAHVSAIDISFATELGYRIKLLGLARLTENGLEQRLHPAMVPSDAPIAQVEGVFNAVIADGDAVDIVLHEGRGAGAGPTASAVVADIIDIARGLNLPVFGTPTASLTDHQIAPMADHIGGYYVRLMVVDRPGVLADIAAVLRDHHVSIENVIQRARNPNQPVPIVITSHMAREADMVSALAVIAASAHVLEPPRMIRIETF